MSTESRPIRPLLPSGWRGVLLGAVVALGLPLIFWVTALLVTADIAPYEPVHALFDAFSFLALLEIALGPLGIVMIGAGARVHGVGAWIAVMAGGLPVVFFAWIASVLMLSGALGNPF